MRAASPQQRSTRSPTPDRPEAAERRVDREATRAPRRLRREVVRCRASVAAAADQVGGALGHRGAMRARRRATIAMPESYGTFSHLWASVAHESAAGDAAHQRAARPGSPRPTGRTRRRRAASAPSRARRRPRSRRRVEGAGVHVAGLRAHDASAAASARGPRASASARIRPWPSAARAARARLPRPEQRSAERIGRVRLLADDDVERRARRAGRRFSTSQPARASTAWRAGGEAGEVRHLAAGHEAHRGGRAAARAGRAPIRRRPPRPRRRRASATWSAAFWSQAAASQSAASAAGHAAADDEAEVARPRRRDQAGLGAAARASMTSAGRIRRRATARPAPAAAPEDGARSDRALRQGLQVLLAQLQGSPEPGPIDSLPSGFESDVRRN